MSELSVNFFWQTDMNYIKDSLKFILKHNFRMYKNVHEEEIRIAGFSADVYIPRKNRTTILLIHGMSSRGNKDHRIVSLSRSFASAGYKVITPHFKKIASLKIEKSEIKDIVKIIKAISADKDLIKYDRIGIFSASFSGALALIAAADSSVKDRISSILIVGGYGDVQSTIEKLIESTNHDDYAAMITFYNFIELASGKKPDLSKAFFLAAMDDSKNTDTLTPHLQKLNANDRNLFYRLKTDPHARINYWKKILKGAEKRNIHIDDLSPYPILENIDAAVTFIHGRNDTVILPEQSVKMHEKLIKHGKKSRLLLTPILSHGNVSLGISRFAAIFELAKAFSFFFRNMRKFREKNIS